MSAVKLRKDNRIINVDESQVEGYLLRGYDQIDTEGNIVKEATGGKNITVAEHNKVLKDMREELSTVKQALKDAKDEIEVLEKENDRLDKLAKSLQKQSQGQGQSQRRQ